MKYPRRPDGSELHTNEWEMKDGGKNMKKERRRIKSRREPGCPEDAWEEDALKQ